MILVKVVVRPSRIHGLGVFAVEPIPAGTPISRWTPGVDYVLTEDRWQALPETLRGFLAEFCWLGRDGRHYGSVDDGRFMNHSATPNVSYDPATEGSYANRDIVMGEELTENYGEFDKLFYTYEDELR